jgi:hypothetical protein
MVPTAMPEKTDIPVMSSPAMDTATVRPEVRMVCPDVSAAICNARSGPCPAARSSRSRRM